MAEEKKTTTSPRAKKPKNSLIGTQAQPTHLDNTTKIGIDTQKILVDNIIEAGLNNRLDTGELEKFTSISNSRDQIYQLIDSMAQDSTVSAILRTYAEDVCETADNGHIVWCESKDPKVSKFVSYLLNIMNVDKNIFGWVYCLLKYGDVYLRLFRESDYEDSLFKSQNIEKMYSVRNVLNETYAKKLEEDLNLNIHNTADHYSFYVEMVSDPGTMFELVKYGKTYGYIETPNEAVGQEVTSNPILGVESSVMNYKLKSNDINVYQADDFVHAYLEDGTTRTPEQVELFNNEELTANADAKGHTYTVRRGKSLLYDSYKIWREKSLLEASAILNRVTRSSILRKVSVEVGDMSKEQVQLTLRRVKELFEQKTALKTGSSIADYSNPGPIENNIYFATHNGQGAITVESVGGDIDVKNLADLDWWNNKFYASYGIPKQYFGWTEDGAGFNGGSSLTILSSVYAKGVKRVQNAILQALTDAINLFLIDRGYNSYINNFVLKMRAPLTQEEIDYRSDLTNRITAISNMQSLFNDVEDKSRRLEILKELVLTLNYGDGLIKVIQEEIDAIAEAEKLKAEEEALAATNETTDEGTEEKEENLDDLDLTPMPENLESTEATSLEDISDKLILTEDQDVNINEDDNLPSPEELNSKLDFTENL